ncbi:hypothetical protein D8Z40_00880 [Bordetella pertussis]|nr:hypothetical protein D8Z40_00880 [Bordetella pertussis]QFD84621.1 hypothetical protein D8032_18975 [Bordetella pertussis]CFW44729.1 Uncharacterised protein [Bordetella pertussis]
MAKQGASRGRHGIQSFSVCIANRHTSAGAFTAMPVKTGFLYLLTFVRLDWSLSTLSDRLPLELF